MEVAPHFSDCKQIHKKLTCHSKKGWIKCAYDTSGGGRGGGGGREGVRNRGEDRKFNSGFRNMKRLGILLLPPPPPDGMLK